MTRQQSQVVRSARSERERLLAGTDVTEHRMTLAGVDTAVLVGGDGPPLVLLHGPGEAGVNWRWQLPQLTKTHRVVVPDLPAHGETDVPARIDESTVMHWLDELIERTCGSPPVLVGHVLGGSIALRYAASHVERIKGVVLVDSLGLARFRPSPAFALSMLGFLARPEPKSYERFMGQCAYDLDALKARMDEDWEPFAAYNLRLARSPKAKAAGKLFRRLGLPRIPPDRLAGIPVPTTLIWGRHDRANRVKVAKAAGDRYGWPLHVVEDAADDPMRDQPEGFLRALYAALEASGARGSGGRPGAHRAR